MKNTQLIKGDMPRFMIMSLGICALLLLLFFKSFRVMLICLAVVLMSVVWAFGCMGLFGFGVTVLMSVIAPLLIVVGVPNCVFFLVNAYHHEYAHHGNKAEGVAAHDKPGGELYDQCHNGRGLRDVLRYV